MHGENDGREGSGIVERRMIVERRVIVAERVVGLGREGGREE
jgi:hypothetical protein